MIKRRSTLSSPKFASRRKKRVRLLVALAIIAFMLLLAGIVYFFHLQVISIQQIVVSGNQAIPTSDIQALVQKDIAGNYIRLFPKHNIFLYPKNKIISDMYTEWPRISSIQISSEKFTILKVAITEKQPGALWCGQNILPSTTAGCYLMDGSGFVFSPAADFSGNAFMRFYGPIFEKNGSTTPAGVSPIGAQYLSVDEFARVNEFASILRTDLGLHPESFAVQNTGDMTVTLSNGSRIFLNDTQNASEAMHNFKLLIAQHLFSLDVQTALVPTTTTAVAAPKGNAALTAIIPQLDYIDLRYGANVYYKTR